MWYVFLPILGFVVGGGLAFGLMYPAMRQAKKDQARFQRLRRDLDDEWERLEAKRDKILNDDRRVEKRIEEYNRALDTFRGEERNHIRRVEEFRTLQQEWRRNAQVEAERTSSAQRREKEEWESRLRAEQQETSAAQRQEKEEWEKKLNAEQQELTARARSFDNRVIAYDHLVGENQFLKSQVKDLTAHAAYLEHLRQTDRTGQTSVVEQRDLLGRAYFDEVVATAKKAMTATNLPQNNQRVRTVAERVRSGGVELSQADEKMALEALRVQFEKAVRAQEEREYQAQLREQIREDQKRQREIEAAEEEARRAEQERAAVEAELARARAEATRQTAEAMGRENEELAARHAETIQALQTKLAEAEAKSQRAISNAQLTKKGCVYVISNIGSFGHGVFKIGMTRRSDPMDRVKELGDASVPFPFDVHMQIKCDDAPGLENALHRQFHDRRMNRVNPRKEFFRIQIDEIVSAVERHHGTVEYTADAEAIEFRNSQMATDTDLDEIDDVFGADDDTPEGPPDVT